jgi:hypothetical protein
MTAVCQEVLGKIRIGEIDRVLQEVRWLAERLVAMDLAVSAERQ